MKELFLKILDSLKNETIFKYDKELFDFNPEISQIYITIFQENKKSIRWGSKKATLEKTIQRVIKKLKQNPKFSQFDLDKIYLLFEIVIEEKPCNIRNLTTMSMYSPNRFEPGVNGIKWIYNGVLRYFMPTDAYTHSIMSVNQLLNYMAKQCDIGKKTNKISQRVHLMRREPIEYTLIKSKAYLFYENEVEKLNRGYPVSDIRFSKKIVFERTLKAVDWLVNNINEDGSFLYFYDVYKDSKVDFLHPNNPNYNNILRHSGGIISLLRGYELTKNDIYIDNAKKALKFLISTIQFHKYNNEEACYPFFNKKSKLGGAGIGLVAFVHYYIHTKSEEFRRYMDGLVRHILSRIDENGEMIGYYIHPKFDNPIVNPDDKTKKELFSFYYPGEALLGLAMYYLYVDNIEENLKNDILEKSKLALDFLVEIRPKKYADLFESLPADAWLMQAIEEWIKVDDLKKQSYIDFVFNDTRTMFEKMYQDKNTLDINKDYIGGFYYNYGDHVYHDASRCEGIVSAYYLAIYLKDKEKAEWIKKNMLISAQGLMKTFYTKKSLYPFKNHTIALHSFRFKLTRAWIRVDSIQHAVCFFSRILLCKNFDFY